MDERPADPELSQDEWPELLDEWQVQGLILIEQQRPEPRSVPPLARTLINLHRRSIR